MMADTRQPAPFEPISADGDGPELVWLASTGTRFFRTPIGMLRVTIDGRCSCLRVVLRRVFPLRHPWRCISVADEGGAELGLIERLDDWDPATRALIAEELEVFYGTPRITGIREIKAEFGFFFWDTVTDRGPRQFYVKGRTENVRSAGADRLLVTDVENCRYEIPAVSALSRSSRQCLELVL